MVAERQPALVPVISVEIAKLDRFGQMLGRDMLGAIEVEYGGRNAQHAIESAC
jgi:hypothetical protein